MKVRLNVKNIRFRQGDGNLSLADQQRILAGRLAGCDRVRRAGEALADLEDVLALRGNGATEGLISPLPLHPPEPYRIKCVELRGPGCPPRDLRLKAADVPK